MTGHDAQRSSGKPAGRVVVNLFFGLSIVRTRISTIPSTDSEFGCRSPLLGNDRARTRMADRHLEAGNGNCLTLRTRYAGIWQPEATAFSGMLARKPESGPNTRSCGSATTSLAEFRVNWNIYSILHRCFLKDLVCASDARDEVVRNVMPLL